MTDSTPQTPSSHVERAEPVTRVPFWVIGMALAGVVGAVIDIPGFLGTFHDAVTLERASRLSHASRNDEAAGLLKGLLPSYPKSTPVIIALGMAQHDAGAYADSLDTFRALEGVELSRSDVDRINAAIDDSSTRLTAPPTDSQ